MSLLPVSKADQDQSVNQSEQAPLSIRHQSRHMVMRRRMESHCERGKYRRKRAMDAATFKPRKGDDLSPIEVLHD